MTSNKSINPAQVLKATELTNINNLVKENIENFPNVNRIYIKTYNKFLIGSYKRLKFLIGSSSF